MRGKNSKFVGFIIPLILFLILLATRLFFSFQTPYLSDDSYQHLVKAENPFEKGSLFANSIFYYVLAGVLLITKNAFVLKVFSNIFFVLASLMVYFIALRLSKSRFFSFLTALISGLLPVYFSQTFNLVSPLSFGLFLLFFNIYAFLNADKKSWLITYIISFIIFSFTHWLVLLFILCLAFYHMILKLEGIKQKPFETELSLFSIFFGLWAQILVCKKLCLLHGLKVFSLNIPGALTHVYFPQYSISAVMTLLGIIPLLAGLYVIYKYLFEKKGKSITLIISFTIIAAVLFLLKITFASISLILLGLFFCILLARWFSDFKVFVKTTKGVKLLSFFVIWQLSKIRVIGLQSIHLLLRLIQPGKIGS